MIPELPAAVQQHQIHVSEDDGSIEKFYFHLCSKKGPGKRRPHMFALSVFGFQAGLDHETILDAVRWWNSQCEEPHDDHAVVLQVNGGMQFVARMYGKEA